MFGTDPEVFIYSENLGVISPALLEIENIIKPVIDDEKHPVFIDEEEFQWHMDGCAMELKIKRGLRSAKEIKNILDFSLESLENFVKDLNYKGEKLVVKKVPTIELVEELYLDKLNNKKVYQGFIFGCDPDRDALSNYKAKTRNIYVPYRFGGGHIHVSNKLFYQYTIPAVKLLMITVGNYVIKLTPHPELEKMRSQFFSCGRYRPQKYGDGSFGIEYRSPSNTWISFSTDKIEEILYLINKVDYLLKNPKIGVEIIKNFEDRSISAIQNADVELASNILSELSL